MQCVLGLLLVANVYINPAHVVTIQPIKETEVRIAFSNDRSIQFDREDIRFEAILGRWAECLILQKEMKL